jgi:N-acetylneuraminic acid mutarotase
MVVQNDKMYVYGGLGGNGMKNSLVEYNLKTSQWREIVLNGIPPSEGRTGHSVVCFRSSLYFFGGSLMYNRRVKHRESFNTIY